MVASILAFIAFNLPDNAPRLLEPFTSHEACLVKADKMNRTTEELRTPEAREAGLEFVCLKVSRVSV